MTNASTTNPPKTTIFGPYSPWPHRPHTRRRIGIAAGVAAGLGLFFHCIVPMIVGL